MLVSFKRLYCTTSSMSDCMVEEVEKKIFSKERGGELSCYFSILKEFSNCHLRGLIFAVHMTSI
jgi:hypothetical protein